MVTTQSQSPAVVKFNMFPKDLKTDECTSFLGKTSLFRPKNAGKQQPS